MPTIHSNTHRWWGSSLAALFLAGCSSLPQPPHAVVRYDLGPPPALTALAQALPPIALAPMQAPLQADGNTAVQYRLIYANAQVLQAYAQARWSLPPAKMVLQRLREHLGQGGRIVLSAEAGDFPPSVQGSQVPVLRLALEEFSQVFSSEQDSAAWVRVRATLVNPSPQGDVLLAQHVFAVQQPAAASDAAAGVQALTQGVDVVGQQIVQWLDGEAALATQRSYGVGGR